MESSTGLVELRSVAVNTTVRQLSHYEKIASPARASRRREPSLT